MRRLRVTPRVGYRARFAQLGFTYADVGGTAYWDETAAWELTADEVDMLDTTTQELHGLCMEAAAYAIRHDAHEVLGIPPAMWTVVLASWRRRDPSIYGRMDLRWDGTSPPQLLEYNADTPTALFEAAVVQWDWMRTAQPGADQFNSIHETLIAAWGGLKDRATVHFTCMADQAEDRGTLDYLRDTAMQAGLAAPYIAIYQIGWDGRHFVDNDARRIGAVFKLYPTDWMLTEEFGAHMGAADTLWIEPPWRLMLASKGMLALLWQLFPGHKNLLPAYRSPGLCGGPELAKPLFGREGANISAPGLVTPGPYTEAARVYQAYRELPQVGGSYPVFGTWVVGARACGLGVREDDTPITRDTSRFVPHFFQPRPDAGRTPS